MYEVNEVIVKYSMIEIIYYSFNTMMVIFEEKTIKNVNYILI